MPPPVIQSPAPWKPLVAFWAAAACWGTSFLWIKLGLEAWDPVSLVAFRLLFASVLFAVVIVATRQRIEIAPGRWWVLPVVAVVNPYIPFLLISWAEVRVDTGAVSVLNATAPLFLLVLAPLFLPEEKPTRRTCAGILIGFAGVAVLFSGQIEALNASLDSRFLGELAVLLASLLYATSTILLRRFNPKVKPLIQAAILNTSGCVMVWIQGVATGQLRLPSLPINWIAVVWLGALGSFLAYTLAMYVLETRGATQTTLINFAYPLFGLVLGIVVLGEPFSMRLGVGGALILSGIGLVKLPKLVPPAVAGGLAVPVKS